MDKETNIQVAPSADAFPNKPEKTVAVPQKNNSLLIFLMSVLLLLAIGVAVYFAYRNFQLRKQLAEVEPTPVPLAVTLTPTPQTIVTSTFMGTVKKGSQVEGRDYCSSGLYLVADEGMYLAGQTSTLLLKEGSVQESKMVSDESIVDKKVQVTGKYPAQKEFCEALICGCEDYILATEITPIQ